MLADVLDCPTEYLLSEQPGIVSDIYEKFGKDRSLISKNLLLDIEAYFSCDYISQEEKDTLMFAIHESYIQSRKNNSDSWKKIKARYPEWSNYYLQMQGIRDTPYVTYYILFEATQNITEWSELVVLTHKLIASFCKQWYDDNIILKGNDHHA